MDSQLTTLIAFYQEESDRLQALIKEYLAEQEYEMAHFHQKALYKNEANLFVLRSLEDKRYGDKFFLMNSIERSEKSLDRENYLADLFKDLTEEDLKRLRIFIAEEIEKSKEQLADLNKLPIEEIAKEEEEILNDALKELIGKKVKKVQLILHKADDFRMSFTYSSKKLKITIPNIKKFQRSYFRNDSLNKFLLMGFVLKSNNDKLELVLIDEKPLLFEKLNSILIKIIFGLFHFKQFEKESFVEITEYSKR